MGDAGKGSVSKYKANKHPIENKENREGRRRTAEVEGCGFKKEEKKEDGWTS